jgi:hypothetical protein
MRRTDQAATSKLLTRDEARRIAANVAKLPETRAPDYFSALIYINAEPQKIACLHCTERVILRFEAALRVIN